MNQFIASTLSLLSVFVFTHCITIETGSKGKWDRSNLFASSKSKGKVMPVRTTAYTHTEADHIAYSNKNALGTTLKYYSRVRSAAADWSKYPVGTRFRIVGKPEIYEIDDYGSALVGKNTIDLYKPSRSKMNDWGTRNVEIEVIKWGSYRRSMDILKDRTRYGHVRSMVKELKKKVS